MIAWIKTERCLMITSGGGGQLRNEPHARFATVCLLSRECHVSSTSTFDCSFSVSAVIEYALETLFSTKAEPDVIAELRDKGISLRRKRA